MRRNLSIAGLFSLLFFFGTLTSNAQSPLPFSDDFESFTNGRANQNGWSNVNASDPDWTADNGGTGSTGTGPDVDHTLGNSTGRYIYLETSGGTTGTRDTLTSPGIIIGASQNDLALEYWYHMAGATMGQMQIWIESAGVWDSVTTYVGPQQSGTTDPWLQGFHLLNGYAGDTVTINFIGEKGTSFTGDMAIDDVSLIEAPQNDIGITGIIRPNSGCGLSTSDTVEVIITNFGAAAQTSFSVGYSVNGVAIIPETVTASLGVGMSMNYTFTSTANLSTSGDYDIDVYTLLTGDTTTVNDSSSITVTSIPTISSFPYQESFETGSGGWTVEGTTTFALGAPAATTIDTASDGTQAWVTNLTGLYNSNEAGWVNSPCLDFSNISNPHIELDVWWNSEFSWDGAVLQSSIDDGATWQIVGAFGDTVNWYTDNTINGLSGIEPSQEGWTGRNSSSNGSAGWLTARRALSNLGGQPNVKLRIAFGSDGSVQDEGFAFDNVRIYEVYAVPFAEDFEDFNNGRANQNDWDNRRSSDPDWTADNGGTTSSATGPDVDHTLGTSAGIYIYLETSSGSAGDRDTLSSPSIIVGPTQTNLLLEYWYHMAGATMGQMQVWVESAGIWDSVTTYVGPQQNATSDPWLLGSHIITGYAGQDVTLHFIGEKGTSFTGDMAVDDVTLTEAPNENIGISSVIRPTSACGLSSTDSVEVVITNFGAAAQSSFDVGYSVNGVAITPETVTSSLGVGMSMNYTFATTANLSTPGDYLIEAYTLLTGDSITSNDTSSATVTSIPTISSFPYAESFESGNGGWIAEGATTFQLGAPAATIIDTASDGTQAWVTNLAGIYNSNEAGWVNSPCFDMSTVLKPYIELDVWWNSEFSWDGAVLQSSIDGGATWQKVGAFGDTVNWYTDNTINGLSGIEPSQEGWSGRNSSSNGSAGWLTARRSLDSLIGQSSVRFRIAFGSDGSVQDEGFAFDNVRIYDDSIPPPPPVPYYPVGIINTVDANGVADSLNVRVKTSGTVVGVDLDGNNGLSFYIVDMSTGFQEGINIFNFNDVSNYVVNEGDSILVIGDIDQFNGLQEVFVDSISVIKTNAFIPAPRLVTNLDETTEANLIELRDLRLLDGSQTFSYNMDATNGTDTITIRVDADTDVNDSLNINPWVAGDTICSIIGVGGQFDNSSPYTSGYQIFPMRFSDIDTASCQITSVAEIKGKDGKLNIYPNPTNDVVTIIANGLSTNNARLMVRDITGKIIFEERLNSNSGFSETIDLSDRANGVYFITIMDGDNLIHEKLIKN
jgi:hypothetical protein